MREFRYCVIGQMEDGEPARYSAHGDTGDEHPIFYGDTPEEAFERFMAWVGSDE